MASTPQLYLSTDPGAPVLSGLAGSLIALLDAVLVDGYLGTVVSSITGSGTTATATTVAPHGLVTGARVKVSGCTQAEYNGTLVITVTGANTFIYTMGSGATASPATGAPAVVMAPAGWAKAFAGSNKAAYRPPTGNRHYLRVLDDGSIAAGSMGARAANWIGYESMTGIDTGSNKFPSSGAPDATNGGYVYKSSALDATARQWVIVADDRTFYLFAEINASNPGHYLLAYFGELNSNLSGDAYATFITVESATAITGAPALLSTAPRIGVMSTNWQTAGLHLARSHSLAAGSIAANLCSDAVNATPDGNSINTSILGFSSIPIAYPDPVSGGLLLATVRCLTTSGGNALRGTLPGLYHCLQVQPVNHLSLLTGITGLAGRTVVAVDVAGLSNIARQGQAFLDITGPWHA
jgi:hypothetical protein